MTNDYHKGITIQYNYLNLPQRVTFSNNRTISFTYDATGKKWRKLVNDGVNMPKVRDYIDGVEYTSNKGYPNYTSNVSRDIINFSEGYIQYDASTTSNYSWQGWVYKYALKDHLGNTRVVLSDRNDDGIVGVADIEQINNYYPFGMNMDGPWNGANGAFKYQYNGKELSSEFGLNWNDYGARFYDPAIGRWNGVDALAEKYIAHSPFHYANNNPVKYIDIDGRGLTSTHTDKNGEVKAVYDDGDYGVYEHEDWEKDKKTYSTTNTSAGGKLMGKTEFWDEFVSPDSHKAEGHIIFSDDKDESWDKALELFHEEAMKYNLEEIAKMSKSHQRFDIKTDIGTNQSPGWAYNGVMTGRKLLGKYYSARSAGNFLAGWNGSTGKLYGFGVSDETYMKLAGALQVQKYNVSNAIDLVSGVIEPFGPPPYYGEQAYSGRMIQIGLTFGRKGGFKRTP